MKTVVGMFNTTAEAQRTLDELSQLGFGPKDISVITNLSAQRSIGSKFDLVPLDVSDLGRIAACGPIAESLRKSTPNGLTATLQYYGLSPKLAEHYALGVQHGETLETLTVEDNDADRVVAIMEKHARMERETEARAATPKEKLAAAGAAITGAAVAAKEAVKEAVIPKKMAEPQPLRGNGGPAMKGSDIGHIFGKDEERRIPVLREELRVGKREVERGGVRVSVHVKEVPVSEHISLREEHVEIERRAVDRSPLPEEVSFQGEDLEFDEYGEETVISKEARVVEEIVVHKRVVGHDEVVNDTIRSTEVRIDSMHDLNRADYQRHFASLNVGSNFDDYLPAYELGHKLRVTNPASATDWTTVETSAQQTWESAHPGTWQRFKDAIRYAWSKAHIH